MTVPRILVHLASKNLHSIGSLHSVPGLLKLQGAQPAKSAVWTGSSSSARPRLAVLVSLGECP